jgi:hypothetical protein
VIDQLAARRASRRNRPATSSTAIVPTRPTPIFNDPLKRLGGRCRWDGAKNKAPGRAERHRTVSDNRSTSAPGFAPAQVETAVMLFDHVDLRVSDLAKVRPLYDALLPAMGFSRTDEDAVNVNFHRPERDRSAPFFGLMTDPDHRPNRSRLALRAQSRAEVDRLAAIALAAGAQSFEAPSDYNGAAWYYASFFEDADGNKLEICFRAD